MRKIIPAAALLVVGVYATIGFTYRNGRPSVNTQLNVKDLQEHGLTLIKSTDDYYKSVISAASQNQLNARLEALKPFSVLLRNTNNKSLIAFRLKWEITKANGQVFTAKNGYMNSRRLFDIKDKSRTKSVVEPGAALFCSVAGVAAVSQLANVQFVSLGTMTGSKDEDGSGQQVLQEDSSKAALDNLIMRLSEATNITVSIDGAVFEDGTFVGADSSNFFGWLSSLVKARRDLLQELKTAQKSGDSDKVQKSLEEVANSPKVDLGPKSSSDDFYRFNKKRFAQHLLGKKNALGDEAVQRELESLNKSWLNLRKL